MDIDAYLHRISFKQPVKTDLQTLVELQRHHLLNIPFENLDIHYQRPISLDPDAIYDKVLRQKRGGFCYELNGLFCAMLKSLGFKVKMISARVHQKEGGYSPEFDHMALLVTIDNDTYLVDVGFGRFSLQPLLLREEVILKDPHGNFVFDSYQDHYRINLIEKGERMPQYIFTIHTRQLKDFAAMCHFHQQSPDSHFSQKKVISLSLEKGRITLNDDTLKVTNGDVIKEEHFASHLFEEKLHALFGIDMKYHVK
jgi:N-hydroxyarylamine O-acetyltransferase